MRDKGRKKTLEKGGQFTRRSIKIGNGNVGRNAADNTHGRFRVEDKKIWEQQERKGKEESLRLGEASQEEIDIKGGTRPPGERPKLKFLGVTAVVESPKRTISTDRACQT